MPWVLQVLWWELMQLGGNDHEHESWMAWYMTTSPPFYAPIGYMNRRAQWDREAQENVKE